MRILADENFPRPTVEALRAHGHDVVWARVASPAARDSTILDRAEHQGRVVVTLDKGFGRTAIQRPSALTRSGVIVFRLHPATPSTLTPLVLKTLALEHRWVQHLTIVTMNSIEMISLKRSS